MSAVVGKVGREEWSVDGVVGGMERGDMVGRWDGV